MLEIRKATPDDHSLLIQMYLSEIEKSDERARTFADILISRYETLLAFKNRILSGTVSWELRGGIDDGVVELTAIGVNAQFRRQNIARRLVESMIKEASMFFSGKGHRLRVVFLFMEKSNEVARKFYSSLKFEETAAIPELYPNDDGVIWIRHF
ncbi:MAG: GNAT family N-acetyltransferase [Promethearchaeota archaeon]